MPSPGENGRGRARKTDDEFVLFLQGIPAHCRWQELKDLVRQTAVQIRQAVVYDDHHGFPTGLGQIIVKHEEAAWRTYHKLSTSGWCGQSLVVTLARTSSPTRPIAGPTKSPSGVIPGYANGYSTPPMSPESPIVPTSPSYNNEYGMSPMAVHHHPPHHPHPLPPVHHFDPSAPPWIPGSPVTHSSFCEPPPFPCHPTYSTPSSHTPPSNIRHAPTHPRKSPSNTNRPQNPFDTPQSQRSIFIQSLPAATSAADLRDLLHPAGTITHCEIFLDPVTGLCRGFARVTFHTCEEARRAVVLGNNSFLRGTRIRVRYDRHPWLGRTHDRGVWGWRWNGMPAATAPTASTCPASSAAAPAAATAVDVAPAPAPLAAAVPAPTSPAASTASPPVSVVTNRSCDTVDRNLQQPLVVNGSGTGFGKRVEVAAESA